MAFKFNVHAVHGNSSVTQIYFGYLMICSQIQECIAILITWINYEIRLWHNIK